VGRDAGDAEDPHACPVSEARRPDLPEHFSQGLIRRSSSTRWQTSLRQRASDYHTNGKLTTDEPLSGMMSNNDAEAI